MTWTDLTANMARYVPMLVQRFPNTEPDVLDLHATTADTLVAHVADRHDLTRFEARQEIDDLLFVQSLARQAGDLRAG